MPHQINIAGASRFFAFRRLPIHAVLLALSACGGTESPSPESSQSSAAPTGSSQLQQAVPPSQRTESRQQTADRLINSLTFEATGEAEYSVESDGSDLMLTGGCLDRNVIGMSFTRGQIAEKDLFQLRLRTADSVEAGETGTFAVPELGWYNGQFKPEGLPTEANVLVPDAWEGSGTLTLKRHDPGGGNGRLAGTVEGTVLQMSGGNEAKIEASFDVNIGCLKPAVRGVTGQ